MKQQNRIEGSYTIVSTYQAETRTQSTMAAVKYAWNEGQSVAILLGVWLGKQEESLQISGHNHAVIGQAIALEYAQDAYIVVGDGIATLFVWNGHSYIVGNVWTKQIDVADGDSVDSYTQSLTGRRFVFAA